MNISVIEITTNPVFNYFFTIVFIPAVISVIPAQIFKLLR